MKKLLLFFLAVCLYTVGAAQNVTIKAVNQPAAMVFRSIIEQTGKNFVYSSELLKDMRISVNAQKKPLKNVLDDMFKNTDIEYKIKGKNIILKHRSLKQDAGLKPKKDSSLSVDMPSLEIPKMLDEVVVVSRLEAPAVETSE